MVSKPLADYNIIEKQTDFLKTHRSYVINLQKVSKYQKDSGGYIVMKNGDSVNLSRYKKDEFMELMHNIR